MVKGKQQNELITRMTQSDFERRYEHGTGGESNMANCKNYKTGEVCENFYECRLSGDYVEATGKRLEKYCAYCLGTPRVKKIGHIASWSGSTPKWCPLGRGII